MTTANDIRHIESGLAGRFWALIADMREQRRLRRDYTHTFNELNSLSDRDLNDLGISRGSIADIAEQAAYGK